jgi:hypothetical protein
MPPYYLHLTDEGISSPTFSLSWDRIQRVWIGPRGVLNIEPIEASDIRWRRSRLFRPRAIRIPAARVSWPLEELVAEIEQRRSTVTGRPSAPAS